MNDRVDSYPVICTTILISRSDTAITLYTSIHILFPHTAVCQKPRHQYFYVTLDYHVGPILTFRSVLKVSCEERQPLRPPKRGYIIVSHET